MEEGNRPRDRSRSRERRGRSRDREHPGKLGNAHAVDVIGSGQKTATSHGETGIDPRIETGLPENENVHDPKIANRTRLDRSLEDSDREDDRLRRSRPLDREREEDRERERRPRSRELFVRERALLSFRAPRSKDREPRDDTTRERSSETSLQFPTSSNVR